MRLNEFADLHNISYDTVGVFVMYNRHREFIKGKGNDTRIDNQRLEYMLTSRRAALHTAHDIYYQIEARGVNDMDQARILSKLTGDRRDAWTSFLSRSLFMIRNESITGISHKQKIYQYIKAAHAILKVLDRHDYKYVA